MDWGRIAHQQHLRRHSPHDLDCTCTVHISGLQTIAAPAPTSVSEQMSRPSVRSVTSTLRLCRRLQDKDEEVEVPTASRSYARAMQARAFKATSCRPCTPSAALPTSFPEVMSAAM